MLLEYFVSAGDFFLPSKLRELVEEEYSDVMEFLRSNVCPVCRRSFKSRTALAKHIKKSYSCKYSLLSLAREVVEEWEKLREESRSGKVLIEV
jgi:uncharacterized C2H2 Zn-finger protein